ncbi:MAG: S8 family serine peptidase [Bacteroidota bacterium]
MAFRSALFFVLFYFYSIPIYSQNVFQSRIDYQKPILEPTTHNVTKDSVVNLIVEFREAPLFIAQLNTQTDQSVAVYQNRFTQFENDLRRMTLQKTAANIQSSVIIQKRFYKSFFGISVQMPMSLIPAVEQISYVKKVHENKTVNAFIQKSAPQSRINNVWSTDTVKGEGVVVGIIDSGIDYLHPALGGGLGLSFKVIGGYDFVNSDNDPMDDNGHGTHVAGIISADAVDFQGVAPKVKLYGLKVLNAEGRGSQSTIIEAIERAVDPNQDGDMSDKLDVVNMSLGSSYGDADDAACTAVDQATALGVTFVVAAGNDGRATPVQGKEDNYYYTGMETIGSPGSARSAITVGAIDSVNKVADFSSKGPTRIYYDIKPDVVAPGVNIRSLSLGNGFSVKTGTSMATPMVTGVAALLKSNNKSLSPLQIKSAIANSSVDLGFKTIRQGSGKVGAMRAMANTSFVKPTQLSFGLDDPALTTWTKVDTLTISNTGDSTQNYSVGFSPASAGITLSAVPNKFSLAAGTSQQILVTIAVNNAVVPIVDEDIILYDGFAHIFGSRDTLHLPWLFARTTRMLLTFNESHPYLVGSSNSFYIVPFYNSYYSKVRWIDSKTLEVSGAFPSTYDFAVFFRNSSKLILKSNLQFTGAESFSFNSSDAIHPVNFNGVDQNGVPLSSLKTQRILKIGLPIGWLFAPLLEGVKTVLVSSASANFSFMGFEALIDLTGAKRVVIPQYSRFNGISGEVNLTNNPAGYYKQTLQFKVPENITSTRIFSEVFATQTIIEGETYGNTIIVAADTVNVMNKVAIFDLFLMKQIDSTFGASVAFYTNNTYKTDDLLDMATRYFTIFNDSIMLGFPAQANWLTTHKSASGDTMRFGESPVRLLNVSYNNSFGPSIHFNPLFFGSLFEQRYSDINSGTYTIYNEAGEKLKEDKLNVFPRRPYEVTPGKYRLEIESQGYSVSNAKGKLTLVNNVDLTKSVPDAPMITSFTILNSKKKISNSFVKNEQASLRFSSKILAGPPQLPMTDSTKVYYRKYKTSSWIALPVSVISSDVEREGTIFSASLSPAIVFDTAAIDLKIKLADAVGNTVEQILSPAFSIGNWVDDGTINDIQEETATPVSFALYQNYPNPFNPVTTIRYDVPGTSFVRLSVYDVLGREVQSLVKETQSMGKYSVQFDAHNLSSGVYFYRLSVGQQNSIMKMLLVK